MKERTPFQHLPSNENPHFLEDGKRIYKEMKQKYPNVNDEDLDNILNGICAALICLICDNVSKDNYKYMTQLVYNILNKNLG
jgi:hypothetical protein